MNLTPTGESGLLEGLTDAQRRAVTQTEGPLLVLAAAGSGKTRVITRRAAYLVLEVCIPPWQVLSITFTNKAAGEMRERIAGLVSQRQARSLTIGTFHALCAKLLRQYHEPAAVKSDFTIFDSADQQRAMKQVFKDLDISTGHFTPGAVLGTISNAKNQLHDAEAYAATASDFYTKKVAQLYKAYARTLTRSGALDFDDLLLKTAKLLQHHEPTRTELQERYQYVQIDEYQDTNHAQFVIAHTLAAGHRNLCVVGDPDQSIYGWRGADIRNILEFEQQYPDAAVVELGQNYRSSPQILHVADTLIRHNKRRRHKDLFTENTDGDKPRLIYTGDEEQEAEEVIGYLRKHSEAGVPWGGMAVFYRVNALSRVMEEALMAASVPYVVARGTAFYQRKEVRDALAYMRVIANADDEVSLLRVINTPARGIGDTSVQHLRAFAVSNGHTLWEAMECAPHATAMTARAVKAVGKFTKMVREWRKKVAESDEKTLGWTPAVRDIVEMVIRDSGLETFYKAEKTGDEEKLANLYELVTAAQRFDAEYGEENATLHRRLHDYLEAVTLVSDADAVDSESGAVTLMTLHAAKGLEFPVIAMIGLEEGLLPHSRAMESPEELEEERRLCFVGITRAQQHLMLSHARYRTVRGLRDRTIPSQFLRELGKDTLEAEDLSGAADSWGGTSGGGGGGGDDGGRGAFASELGFGVGTLVRHPQFGLGRVLSLTPNGAPTRAKVHFDATGPKTLVLQYARLEVVEK